MKEQFIPYEQALELKELGFNEECFAWYNMSQDNLCFFGDDCCADMYAGEKSRPEAPLWQQAFDWFRDKYNLVSEIFHNPEYEWKNWKYRFYWTTERLRLSNISDGHYETYEEARLECLKKLIKIVELEK